MRLHSEFSIVDSTCRIDDVVQAAADDQQPALAITDLSNLFGALKLYKEYGRELTITGLRDAFKTGSMPELGLNGDQRVKDLAVMLNPYTRDGEYARFFEGRNNVDFENDFVVIENEELKRRPDLHAVVNILLLHQITGEMYLTRNRRKVLLASPVRRCKSCKAAGPCASASRISSPR